MPMSTSSVLTTSGSTKSDSSTGTEKSQKSQQIDFSIDNTQTPVDSEAVIQAERLLKIIDQLVSNTKLAICIPKIMEHFMFLDSVLSASDRSDLFYIFEQYESASVTESQDLVETLENIKAGDFTTLRLYPELAHMLHILTKYKKLKSRAATMIKDMKAEYNFEKSEKFNPTLEYLLTLEKFRTLMFRQLNMSAAEELTLKINHKQMEEENRKCIAKNEKYKTTLKEESDSFAEQIKGKKMTIAKLTKELEYLRLLASKKIKDQIRNSDCDMVMASRAHSVKMAIINDEELETRTAYQEQLKAHLAEEQQLRMRKFKVETQLVSWIQKYDLEMNDKQDELDELIEMCKDEGKKIKELEEKMAEQNLDYIPLMAEKEEEYHQEMEAKMLNFRINHCAKVLQMAWRKVLKNRDERKKLRKQQKNLEDAIRKKKY